MLSFFPKKHVENWLKRDRKVMNKGEFIMSPGEQLVYILVKGTAQIFHLHPDGKECVIGLAMPGECIGILELFSQREQKRFTKALTQTEVIALTFDEVKKVITETPELSMFLLHYVTERLEETLEILEQVAYGKVEERLLFLLNKLAEKDQSQGEFIRLPDYLTHRDLAGMIASTRETVTFLMNKFLQVGTLVQIDKTLWLRISE
ncbi:Crp/Fnr family transcriptional regulator [Bacillus sp. 3H-10]|nr:Crp/Fnr family transcriptional regulator [Bacillus aquiflavi]NEY82109.1 Crp/Fnr family transcriptional regulator [Bacillus aquiflavi]UAC48443.1 Crp/Fnr family transcriptional regulator [Bacillus aquiflavi]